MDNNNIEEFIKEVWKNPEKRTFPWRERTREKDSAWGVLVSEFMLQQTRTERVLSYWPRWMERWPTAASLAAESLERVLQAWSGLGYNRRGRYLWESAGIIAGEWGGRVPDSPEALQTLPGVGPYSAGAIACFAYNYPAVFIETNIRSAVIHFFFPGRRDVSDREVFSLLKEALGLVGVKNVREWYGALMDYGAAVKKTAANPGRQSAHYARQSPFAGSFRQIRGALVRALVTGGPQDAGALREALALEALSVENAALHRALSALERDSLVTEAGGVYRIGGKGMEEN